MSIAAHVFGAALVSALLLDLILVATLIQGSVRGWPPPSPDARSYRLTWTLFPVLTVGFLVVGGLDAGSLGLSRWMGEAGALILGSMLFMGGTTLASYAMGFLGMRGMLGLEAELVTEGPFAVSRNPGYLGDLVLIVGYVILTDSRLAGIVGATAAVWFLLAPFVEEPWLEVHHGDAYRRYQKTHPRFLGPLPADKAEGQPT